MRGCAKILVTLLKCGALPEKYLNKEATAVVVAEH